MERLFRRGCKTKLQVLTFVCSRSCIDVLPVVSYNIGNVIGIFEPAFDFYGMYSCVLQLLQLRRAVHIFERQNVTLVQRFALLVT